MPVNFSIKKAEDTAEEILGSFGLDSLPINPLEVCKKVTVPSFPINYEERELNGFLGMTIPGNTGCTIVVSSNIANEGQKNFTIGHELGHAVLHVQPQKSRTFSCSEEDIYGGVVREKVFELEANAFAASLLMPNQLMEPLINKSDIGWNLMQEVKTSCKTSLTASAKRVISLSTEPIALVIHKENKFWGFEKSDRFKYYLDPAPVSKNICSRTLDTYDENLTDSWDECDAEEWVSSSRQIDNKKLQYDSIIIPSLNWQMTLLWDDASDDDADNEWEEPHL